MEHLAPETTPTHSPTCMHQTGYVCCSSLRLLCSFHLLPCGLPVEPLDVSEGWLQCETMVQILIHPTKQQPISMQHKGPIKLCFCLQQREDSGSLLDQQPMHVKVRGRGVGRGERRECESLP